MGGFEHARLYQIGCMPSSLDEHIPRTFSEREYWITKNSYIDKIKMVVMRIFR